MKRYKVDERGRLIFIGYTEDGEAAKETREQLQDNSGTIESYNESVRGKIRKAISEGLNEVLALERKRELTESFKRLHPEWTAKQLEIAARGR